MGNRSFPLISLCFFLLVGFANSGFCEDIPATTPDRRVVVTIDDFPCVGPRTRAVAENIHRICRALVEKKVPAVGFIVGDRGNLGVMKEWFEAGFPLGNHTYSHPAYSKCSITEFLDNMEKNVRAVKNQLGIDMTGGFFRYPYLDHGNTEEKVAAVERLLEKTGGRIAHVSLDTMDYEFALYYARKDKKGVEELYLRHLSECAKYSEAQSLKLFGRPIPLILLLHANELNADCFPRLLQLLGEMGYRFVTLDDALKDGIYQPYLRRPPLVKCKGDRNFLNQMALLRGFHTVDVTGGGWFKRNWKPLLEALPAN